MKGPQSGVVATSSTYVDDYLGAVFAATSLRGSDLTHTSWESASSRSSYAPYLSTVKTSKEVAGPSNRYAA